MTAPTLNLEDLAEAYLVANTPAFLVRRFRADPSVQAVAATYSVEDLVSKVAEHSQAIFRTLDDRVMAYAYLVALTFKSPAEVEAALTPEILSRLEWARTIIDQYRAAAATTSGTVIEKVAKQPAKLGRAPIQISSASTQVAKPSVKMPKVAVKIDTSSV